MNLEEEVVAVIDAMWSHDASGRGKKIREKEKKKGKGKKSLNQTSYSIYFLLLKYSSGVPVLVFSRKLCIHISDTCTHIRAS
jgi:hypothetical protein